MRTALDRAYLDCYKFDQRGPRQYASNVLETHGIRETLNDFHQTRGNLCK